MLRARGHNQPWHILSVNEADIVGILLHPTERGGIPWKQALFEVGEYEPVSPTLRCITGLTMFFFAVYLVIIFVRLAKTVARIMKKPLGQWAEPLEAALIKGTDALAPAPMLCNLLIATRLRAMQLDPSRGDPQWWVQMCMYAGTCAFFLRFLVHIAHGTMSAGSSQKESTIILICRSVASGTVYACCGAIIVGLLIMRAPSLALPPAFSVPTLCVVLLTVAYFVEFLFIEAVSTTVIFQKSSHRARETVEKEIASGANSDKEEAAALQFPPMLCVLLVGIELRSVQLSLDPAAWAQWAMVASTCAVVAQVALAGVNEFRVTAMGDRPLQNIDSTIGRVASASQLALMSILLVGTAFTLVSVFAMDPRPIAVISPEIDQEMQRVTDTRSASNSPPLSAAMRCVTLLTVLYFSIKLPFLTAGTVFAPLKKWANCVLAAVDRALVFTPMLCVMMIGVRLRAMQLHIQDPQEWAQQAMYVATLAVLVQVVCCMFEAVREPEQDDDEDDNFGRTQTLADKAGAILIVVLKHLASATLYAAVATLIVALFTMEPESASTAR